jgi:hypothetical protein
MGKRPISRARARISVDAMSRSATPVPCYLVEWYGPRISGEPIEDTAATLDDCATATCTPESHVRLLTMLAVPSDEVLFGVFTADSPDLVAVTCQRAGIPAQRLTAVVGTRFGSVVREQLLD